MNHIPRYEEKRWVARDQRFKSPSIVQVEIASEHKRTSSDIVGDEKYSNSYSSEKQDDGSKNARKDNLVVPKIPFPVTLILFLSSFASRTCPDIVLIFDFSVLNAEADLIHLYSLKSIPCFFRNAMWFINHMNVLRVNCLVPFYWNGDNIGS